MRIGGKEEVLKEKGKEHDERSFVFFKGFEGKLRGKRT